MKEVYLSKRMEAVVRMVSPQSFAIADVGCDHAYVSIAMLQRKLAEKVIAMDVRTGPLEIARKNVKESGYDDVIDLRLGDGLEQLETDEVDTIIIAGMGGLLIKGILERGIHILQEGLTKPILILQPQSDLDVVRKYLFELSYRIVQEKMLLEDGKYYTVIKAVDVQSFVGEEQILSGSAELDKPYTEEEWVYGRCNLQNHSEVLHSFLLKEQKQLQEISAKVTQSMEQARAKQEVVAETTRQRYDSVLQQLSINKKALLYFDEV